VDLWDLTRLIFRRWYFAVPILLVTLTGVLFASRSVRPDYSATGHLQLIPPAHRNESEAAKAGRIHNPWLDLGIGALGQATVLKVQDERTVKQLVASGYTEHFTITIEYPATFISIEAVGSSGPQATNTVRQVMKMLTDDVKAEQQQFGVAQEDMINTLPLDQGDKVTLVTSKVKRVLIVATAMGLLTTAGCTIGLDALLRQRARRRATAAQAAAAAAGPDGDGDDADATSAVPAQRVNGSHGGRALKTAAQATKVSKGSVFRSRKSSVNLDDGEATSVLSVPRAGEPAEPGGTPIVLEYQQSAEGPDGAKADESRNGNGRPSEPRPMPSDATIVLPLSHKYWDVRDTGGNRR
jgi:hypothetical protein